jgi:succinoglycan biosynthesis protein ExoM
MYHIVISIPTYKRPLMLKRLITSIIDCKIDKSVIKDINVNIVDNDIDSTAEKTIIELADTFYDSLKLNYYKYTVKGLSNVRNELLRRAIEMKPDFIVFIDDDEYAAPGWLNELVYTIILNNGDMVRGPVIPVLDKKVKKAISYWFERPSYPNNFKMNSVAAGNLIIKLNSMLKYNVWFDNRFNITGSEDTYFGEQMISKGATVYWASNAIVYETIPEERAKLKWLLKRRLRVASTFTFRLKLGRKYFPLIKKTMVSVFYIVSGIVMMILVAAPIKIRYWGIIKFYEGIGGLSGLFNIIKKEYK